MSTAADSQCDDRDWSSLPVDVLSSVFELLPLRDYLRSRSVCSSWLCAAADPWRCRPEPPWLMLPPDPVKSNTWNFFHLSGNKLFQLPLPGLEGHGCLGASEGWITTIDEKFQLHAINPLSGARIRLPSSFANFDDIVDSVLHPDGTVSHYLYEDSHIIAPYPVHPDFFRDGYFAKVHIHFPSPPDTSDYIAVAIYGNRQMQLAFAFPGDQEWRLSDECLCIFYDGVFHNGKYYALTCRGIVAEFDLSDRSRPPHLSFLGPTTTWDNLTKYLVVSSGQLLQIWRHAKRVRVSDQTDNGDSDREAYNTERAFRTERFEIFGLDVSDGGNPRWLEVKSLGDQALFLGHNYSVSLSANDFPELRLNCIYFTDNEPDTCRSAPHLPRDLGVYDLHEGSVSPNFPRESPFCWPLPIWYTPKMF